MRALVSCAMLDRFQVVTVINALDSAGSRFSFNPAFELIELYASGFLQARLAVWEQIPGKIEGNIALLAEKREPLFRLTMRTRNVAIVLRTFLKFRPGVARI